MNTGFYPGDLMFQIGPIFMALVFILVIGVILFSILQGIKTWNKNEQSPRLSVPAKITGKRRHTRGGASTDHHTHVHTSYYVTFEFESSDRLELTVSGGEYGLLAEGDKGILTFQGSRYLGFERK